MPRITDIPAIEVHVMDNDADAGGVGERACHFHSRAYECHLWPDRKTHKNFLLIWRQYEAKRHTLSLFCKIKSTKQIK